MFGSFTAMPLHNFNFHSHVLVDMADKPNFRMFRDSFDVRHRAWISNTIHYLETNIKNKRRRTYLPYRPGPKALSIGPAGGDPLIHLSTCVFVCLSSVWVTPSIGKEIKK
jgi:hypothetical protein